MAKPFRPPNPALPYREDCWSEGETDVLVDAWGDRYVEVNNGSLRHQQWQEVADAVNSRPCDARRPPRTDVQCKNRIDTLKKKYKVEKSKILLNNNNAVGSTSQWKFYHKLDELIGSSSAPLKKPLPKASVAPPLALPLPLHRKGTPLPTAAVVRPVERRRPPVVEDSFYRRNFSAAAAAVEEEEVEDESEDSASRSSLSLFRERSRMKRTRNGKGKDGDEEEEEGVRELSKAILRFAEIYEGVEVEKQRQMMELEKLKMEFAKGLEFQRMQIFLDSQVRLAKIKRWREASITGSAERCTKLDDGIS